MGVKKRKVNLLDNYLSSRRLEEEYQDVDTFGNEMLESMGAFDNRNRKRKIDKRW
jgi:hypothetical protein